jgi:hypothetical protein
MGKNYKQGNGYREKPVEWFFFIENKQYEHRKGNTCEYGTERNKAGKVQAEQENSNAIQGHQGLNG